MFKKYFKARFDFFKMTSFKKSVGFRFKHQVTLEKKLTVCC